MCILLSTCPQKITIRLPRRSILRGRTTSSSPCHPASPLRANTTDTPQPPSFPALCPKLRRMVRASFSCQILQPLTHPRQVFLDDESIDFCLKGSAHGPLGMARTTSSSNSALKVVKTPTMFRQGSQRLHDKQGKVSVVDSSSPILMASNQDYQRLLVSYHMLGCLDAVFEDRQDFLASYRRCSCSDRSRAMVV